MRLEPLYTVRFRYRDGWQVELSGEWGREEQQLPTSPEGTCPGITRGRRPIDP